MNLSKDFFHRLSYLQYPLMIGGLLFCYKPLFNNLNNMWDDFNIGLVFMGLGISFSTLQDVTKTQNKISKKIFENEKYARRFVALLFIQVIIFITIGLLGLFLSNDSPLQSLSFGIISIGIGMIGMLKAAGEMAEHHRNQQR